MLGSSIAPQVMPGTRVDCIYNLEIWNSKIQQQSDFEIQLTTEKVHNSSIRNHFQREILAAVHLLLITIVK